MKMERIPFKDLRKIVRKFLNSKRIEERKKKRGRPKKYSDELILSSLLLKLSRGLSFRDLREELRDRIKEETLDLL
ncbi:MAG: hypothetical protein ACP5PT_04150, partial [Brevinematia bacterium]